mmetsp:Transcript_3522/g.3945  ORF Transcript_3522/g.3945 Transcript_3522/m.3945 type:complete len:331 (+) Transcript_3522:278-1270(+)
MIETVTGVIPVRVPPFRGMLSIQKEQHPVEIASVSFFTKTESKINSRNSSSNNKVKNRVDTENENTKQEGYLIANECTNYTRDREDYFEMVQHSWSVFQNIEQKIERQEKRSNSSSNTHSNNNGTITDALRHFYLEPPQRVILPPVDVVERLNSVTSKAEEGGGKFQHSPNYFGQQTNHNYCQSKHVVVQKVRAAPEPHLILRCYFDAAGKRGTASLQDRHSRHAFLRKVRGTHNTRNKNRGKQKAVEPNVVTFLRTVEEEMKNLVRVMEQAMDLWYDFQILIDVNGRIYHMDIDRMEQKRTLSFPQSVARERCIKGIRNFFDTKLASPT